MGRVVGDESNPKFQLVKEICSLSNRAITCSHLHHHKPCKSPFIDWYLLLRVKEDAGIDKIKKQYHKLALQLHPDKNKHPKAEIAFKLVSEAYACLSDNTRRAAFRLDRQNSFCMECNRMPYNSPSKSTAKLKGLFPPEKLRSDKMLQYLDVRARFMEEARVIENCLKANASLKRETLIHNASGKEHPIFSPSDYLSHSYPHYRTRNYTNMESFWGLATGKTLNQGRRKCDSPIFEFR